MHFFGEDICRIIFTRKVLDCNCLVLDPFTNRILVKLDIDMTCRRGCHVARPLDTGVIVIVEDSDWFISGILKPDFVKLRLRLRKSTTFLEVALVARISASQELREVLSCRSSSHPKGPPFLKTIPPLMLQSLKRKSVLCNCITKL